MAKFCGKCGTRLDETTRLCPNCDADKIRKRKKRKILKRCIGLAAFLLLVCIGMTGVLVYLGKVELPVISEAMERFGKSGNSTEIERVIPETDTEGFSYYETSEQNIVKDEETEAVFVNNEILVTLVSENYKEQLQEYLHTIDGSIAGELPEAAEYQILLEEIYSYSELEQMIEDIQNHEWVLSASLNYAAPIDTSYIPNDEKWENEWENVADGTNWGMEAVDAPGAWEYQDRLEEVRIGVFDDMFDVQHEDLKFAEEPYKNSRALKAVDNGEIEWSDHGTHVSGTVAAGFNNKKGVAGVLPKVQLYGASCFGMSLSGQFTTQEWKTGFYYLIVKKKCSVVNVSVGHDEITFGASRGTKTETDALKEISGELGKYLKILIDKKYSFVICGSAGNQNEAGDKDYQYFKKDDDDSRNEWTYYSYKDYIAYLDGKISNPIFEYYRNRKIEIESRLESGNVDAEYDILGAITDPDVQKRIIIVGAARNLGTHKEGGFLGIGAQKVHAGYSVAGFSQCGDRVDVIAPGVDVYSTVKNGYAKMQGTSQAAPHVTGVAGLVFAANSEMKADDVKKIISDSAVGSYREEGYGMVNARNAVEMAFNYKAGETEKSDTEENTKKEEVEQTEPEKTSKKKMIPSDAAEFNGHHYYVYDMDNITTWEQAEAYCESLGGYLATITSREEDEFVYFYLKNNFDYESAYFGFTDREEEGTWVWVNGETSTYTNWNPGEPNDENPNEDYAMYYYKYPEGTWNDGDFGYETLNSGQVFICEWGEPTTVNIYNMYAEKVKEYEERYGEAEVRDDGSSGQYMTGVCFAKLVDFAGDGQKELLVVYSDGSQEGIPQNYTAEVWKVTDGQMFMLYSGEICFSDGGFEYVDLWTGSEKSYLCAGGFGNEWYGFDENGQFKLVREATMRMSQSGEWIYEVNGKEVSSEEYYQNETDWSTGYENTEYWISNGGLDPDKIFREIEETKKELNMK